MLRSFWSWDTTRQVLGVSQPSPFHERLIVATLAILFTLGLAVVLALVLMQLVLSAPLVLGGFVMDCVLCQASAPATYAHQLLDGFAFPNWEAMEDHGPFYPGNRWLFILPLAGGVVSVPWLFLTIVWAPAWFMVVFFLSPVLLPVAYGWGWLENLHSPELWLFSAWPALFMYILVFVDDEDDDDDHQGP
eukprot:FR742886.1.p1 GENE.FR742886.1~~FR742886.1.p1  ORF type:complete len:190 (+),score=31.24 FR742886.1:170-739(+)